MRWIIAAIVFAAAAFGSHYFTVRAVPGFIMKKVQSTFEAQGIPFNRFIASPRQTPETQRVVRPSPDLSYAICRFDVSDGPVLITAPAWDGYGSLSIFDGQTNNVFVASLDGRDASVILYGTNMSISSAEKVKAGRAIEIDGAGIALIRRLAPTDETHEQSVALVAAARCG
jgi:uncharacterized membrane protein